MVQSHLAFSFWKPKFFASGDGGSGSNNGKATSKMIAASVGTKAKPSLSLSSQVSFQPTPQAPWQRHAGVRLNYHSAPPGTNVAAPSVMGFEPNLQQQQEHPHPEPPSCQVIFRPAQPYPPTSKFQASLSKHPPTQQYQSPVKSPSLIALPSVPTVSPLSNNSSPRQSFKPKRKFSFRPRSKRSENRSKSLVSGRFK